MQCPRCSEAMELRHEGLYEDIPLHECTRCHAMWMASESLDRLDDNINVDASKLDWQPTNAGQMRCPSCTASGYRALSPVLSARTLESAPSLVIHRCSRCRGVLLDEPALEAIRQAVVAKTT